MLKDRFLQFVHTFFWGEANLPVRNFNLLALAGAVVSFFSGIASLFTSSWQSVVFCFTLSAFSSGLLYYSKRTGRYRLCYYLTISVVFLLGFSVIFFYGGGYLGGMPLFFVFAVTFTAFIFEGRELMMVVFAEIAVYTLDILLAWHFPGLVVWEDSASAMLDILFCTWLAALSLGMSAYLQMCSYRFQHKELEQAREAADAANQAKTVFLANISHELKTPLTVISGYAQTSCQHLAGIPGTEADVQIMRLITSEIDRMALMVSQLLDVTRIEEDRLDLIKKPVQLDEIIKHTLDAYYPMLSENKNRLTFHRLYDLPPLQLDEARIQQVIVNLLSNAIRYTHNGVIAVGMARKANYVEVSVCDTGDGISPAQLPHLFERFAKKENRAANDTGTGLGLYICKCIVEAHGGNIQVESIPGKGTTVLFTLPIESACG